MARRPQSVYVALIGDLVDSRALAAKAREKLQGSMSAWLEDLSDTLGPGELAAPLTLTAGDEIQGLFRKPSSIVTVVQVLTDRMFQFDGQPRALFGVGRGTLSTRVPPPPAWAGNPALLDGPAFHLARAELEAAQSSGAWVRFAGFGDPREESAEDLVDVVLDALFGLMSAIRERWTANQGAVSFRMRGYGQATPPSQKTLAQALGVNPSVISETLKASRHNQLCEGEEAARKLLATLDP